MIKNILTYKMESEKKINILFIIMISLAILVLFYNFKNQTNKNFGIKNFSVVNIPRPVKNLTIIDNDYVPRSEKGLRLYNTSVDKELSKDTFLVQFMPSVNGLLFKNPKSNNYENIHIKVIEHNTYIIQYKISCSLFLMVTNKDSTVTPINVHIDENQNIRVSGTYFYRVVNMGMYPIVQISYSNFSTQNSIQNCLDKNSVSTIEIGPYLIIAAADTSRVLLVPDAKSKIRGINSLKYPTWCIEVPKDNEVHWVNAVVVNSLGQISYLLIGFNLNYDQYGNKDTATTPPKIIIYSLYTEETGLKLLKPCTKNKETNKLNNDGDYYVWNDGNHNIILTQPKTNDFFDSGNVKPFTSITYNNYINNHNYWFIIQGTINTKLFVFPLDNPDTNVVITNLSSFGYPNCYAVDNTMWFPPAGAKAEVQVLIVGKNNIITSFVISFTKGYLDFTHQYVNPIIEFQYSFEYLENTHYKIFNNNIFVLDQPTTHTNIEALFSDEVYKEKIEKYYSDAVEYGILIASFILVPYAEEFLLSRVLLPIANFSSDLSTLGELGDIYSYETASSNIVLSPLESNPEADALLEKAVTSINSNKEKIPVYINELLKKLSFLDSQNKINVSGYLLKIISIIEEQIRKFVSNDQTLNETELEQLELETADYIPKYLLTEYLGDIWNFEI